MTKKKIWLIVLSAVVVCAVVALGAIKIKSETKASEITIEDAQAIVNEEFDKMAITNTLKHIAEQNEIKVNSVSYGDEKDIVLDCEVNTVDAYSAISPDYDKFMSSDVKKKNSTMFKSALDFKMEFENELISLLNLAEEKTCNISLYLYDTDMGIKLYASDEAVNAVYGGIVDLQKEVESKTTYQITDESGEIVEKNIESGNVKKGFIECLEVRRDAEKPDTSGKLGRTWNKIKDDFHQNFILHDRWKTIFSGLWITIKLTIFSLLIGIVLGFLVAFVRCTYLKTTKKGFLLKLFNAISQLYLTVIRGTPVVVQIMIIYFVIFMPLGIDKFLSAVICFGLNSGAYVAEIVRGGIMSIDNGQMEAGRSLGFNYMQTMWHIVFPQAFKAVLPALANEFVVLLKETSIAFYIGLGDLMYSGNAIRAATYSPFMPLVAVAIIYLIMVIILSKLVGILERRLRNSER